MLRVEKVVSLLVKSSRTKFVLCINFTECSLAFRLVSRGRKGEPFGKAKEKEKFFFAEVFAIRQIVGVSVN